MKIILIALLTACGAVAAPDMTPDTPLCADMTCVAVSCTTCYLCNNQAQDPSATVCECLTAVSGKTALVSQACRDDTAEDSADQI